MSNTYNASLVTSFLIDDATTDLQNTLAPLKAFTTEFSADGYKPLATGELKHVTGGATAQTNATNFEVGNSTIAAVGPTMQQISVSFQVSNADLNSGLRRDNLVTVNVRAFADAVMDTVLAPVTTANFGAPVVISNSATFSFDELAQLQSALKKSPIKNLILDGAYLARVSNTPGFLQPAGTVGGASTGWRAFGWDGVYQNTRWNGAGANIQGFACHPQALVVVAGLPVSVDAPILSRKTVTIPGLDLSVAAHSWFSTSTRTLWASYDIVIGSAAVDLSALKIISSQ